MNENLSFIPELDNSLILSILNDYKSLKSTTNKSKKFDDNTVDSLIQKVQANDNNQVLVSDSFIEDSNQNQNLYKLIINTMTESVLLGELVFDENNEVVDFIVLTINQAFEKMNNVKYSNIVGKLATQSDLKIPTEQIKNFWKKHIDDTKTITEETYSESFDRWFSTNTSPVIDGKFTTIFNDITHQKKYELEIKESIEKFESIFEGAGVGISYFKLNGEIIQVNKKFNEIFDVWENEEPIINLNDIIFTDKNGAVEDFLNKSIKSDLKYFEFEKKIFTRRTKNKTRNISFKLTLNRDKDNNPEYFIGIIEDITDQRIQKLKIETSSLILENLMEGVSFIGYDDWVIKWTNSKFDKMLGYDTGELIGKHINTINGPNNIANDQVVGFIVKQINDHGIFTGELEHVKKDGTHIWSFITIKFIDHYKFGKVFLSNQVEIGERKIIEKRLIEEQENLKLSQSIANIGSWEINLKNNNVLWSEELYKICGLNPNRFKPDRNSIFNLVINEDREILRLAFKNAIDHNLSFRQNIKIKLQDNSIKYILAIGKLIKDEHDMPSKLVGAFQDISSEIKAENELNELIRKNKSLLSSLPGIAYRCLNDSNWTMEYISEGCLDLTGYHIDELINNTNNSYNDLIHIEDRDFVWESIQKKISNKEHYEIEYRIVTKDSQIKWVWEKGMAIYDENGNIIALEGFIHDITDSKNINDIIRSSNQKFENIFNLVPYSVGITNFTNFEIIDVNPTFELVFGWLKEEIIGKTTLEIGIFQDHIKRNLYVKVLSDQGIIENVDLKLKRKNGTVLDALVSSKLYEQDDKTYNLIVIVDITSRKEAEYKLKESEERFRQVIESTEDCIWEVDADGIYTFISPVIERTLGYKPEEIVGKKHFYDLFAIDSMEDYKSKAYEIIETKKSFSKFLNPNLTKDGKIKLIETSGFPILDNSGNLLGYRGVDSDITERYTSQINLIKAKEEAERTNKLKTSFLQNMSHEIRTPLNGIVGFANLLKEFEELSIDERFNFIDIINSSANRLLGIVDDVLSISHLDSGMVKLNFTDFLIEEVFAYFIALYNPKITDKNLNFVLNCNSEILKLNLHFDKDKLYQIITNLLNNALKFTDYGTIEFGVKLENNCISFYVKDTGIGISIEHQDLIFERFWQNEAFSERKFGGTGLGLSIIKGLTEVLNSEIKVDSQLKVGSTFTLTLPDSALKEVQLVKEENESIELLDKVKILIVEDEFINYSYLSKILKKLGLEHDWAKNGVEALELINSRTYSLILMDLKMPLMNGYEATKQIKMMLPNMPIIAQTAYSHHDEKIKALEAGCNDVIIKPIKKDELLGLLSKYLSKI